MMRFTILRNPADTDPLFGWIATEQAAKQIPCRGYGDTPTEALQELMLKMWEAGNRNPELRDALNAENESAAILAKEWEAPAP